MFLIKTPALPSLRHTKRFGAAQPAATIGAGALPARPLKPFSKNNFSRLRSAPPLCAGATSRGNGQGASGGSGGVAMWSRLGPNRLDRAKLGSDVLVKACCCQNCPILELRSAHSQPIRVRISCESSCLQVPFNRKSMENWGRRCQNGQPVCPPCSRSFSSL